MPRLCPAAHGTNPHWQWVSGVQARLPQVWGELEQWGDYNFKKVTFWQLTFCTILFSSNFTMTNLCRYISKGIWIAMNVSLETSFLMSVRPVEKVFCLFALIVLVVSCFLCFSFLTKNTPGWFNLTNYTRHVESRECKVCFQSNPFCHTSDLIVLVSIIPDFRCFQSNIFCCTSDLIVPNWIISDFR